MRKTFRSIDEVLTSDFGIALGSVKSSGLNRILKSTRLEDKIYSDLRKYDADMDSVEAQCSPKLSTFPDLSRDVYQSFYSLCVKRNEESELSDTSKRFNSHILGEIMNCEDYPTIKSVCEGRQMSAYDAASEFISNVSNSLDDLLKEAGGDKGALNTLSKLMQQEEQLSNELNGHMQNREQHGSNPTLDSQIVGKANAVSSKSQQIEAVGQQIRDNLIKNQAKISGMVASAVRSAKDKAEDTALTLTAWGQGESDGSPEQMKLNKEITQRVRQSETLKEVTKFLGRFKEITAKARKNSYAYGRGEKYTLELGNDIQRVITSEFTSLAVPETIPLFLRKYQSKSLQQYKRREPIYKGCGDIIMCLDESSSTELEAPWGKAVAIALLDVAMAGGRKFALIHFSSKGNYKTDVFIPGEYDVADVFTAAETFLGGNTDFETPMTEAYRLIENEGFENADIVFTTDGVCSLPEEFQNNLKKWQQAYKFLITGVLLDMAQPGMDFSLKPFCDDIYRTSQLTQTAIVESLISKRV